MGDKRKIAVAVRYCGGCNPRFDRVKAVQRLAEMVPDAMLTTRTEGDTFPAAVVVFGCASRCADVAGLSVSDNQIIHITSWEDVLHAAQRLRGLSVTGT